LTDEEISDILWSESRDIKMSKTVLITGAAGNLGSAVLKKFLENDFQIAALVSDKHRSKLETTAKLKPFRVDLLDENMVQQTVRQVVEVFRKIDMAVLTAGGFAMGGLAETGEEELNKMYRLNFLTAYHTARQVFMQMQKQDDGGQIILIGSRPAIHPGSARDMLSYALSKSLVFRLAEVINEAGKRSGITASVIVPGIIDTPQNRKAMPDADLTGWVSASEIADNIYHLSTRAGRQLRESIIKVYGKSQA
jgi:NAD(P)-dependent dehydrogenase (short-subunit alcohol dehydrogenase family)